MNKKLGEQQIHDQEYKQRRKNAPKYAEYSTLVLVDEIPFVELLQQKADFYNLYSIIPIPNFTIVGC